VNVIKTKLFNVVYISDMCIYIRGSLFFFPKNRSDFRIIGARKVREASYILRVYKYWAPSYKI